jgi:hypothetical protein
VNVPGLPSLAMSPPAPDEPTLPAAATTPPAPAPEAPSFPPETPATIIPATPALAVIPALGTVALATPLDEHADNTWAHANQTQALMHCFDVTTEARSSALAALRHQHCATSKPSTCLRSHILPTACSTNEVY